MNKLLLLLLPTIALQVRINILTSIIIDEVPFNQKLTCIDCAEPVSYVATDLPSFAKIQGNELIIEGTPNPGQYHLSIEMIDGEGKKAHLLLILVLLDEQSSNGTKIPSSSGNNIVLSVNNNQISNSNLTNLLLQSPAILKNDEQEMKNILERQADINKRIANLLILIRRYRDSKSANERKAAEIAKDLQNLIPSETAFTT